MGVNVTLNHLQFHVETVGKGPPLLMLHGFTGSSENWKPFFSSWGRHCQVIAPDLIGHGTSTAPTDALRYSMDQAADDLALLLDQLDVAKAHILGYSMGGRLALAFAIRHPNRIKTIILESSSPGLKTEKERKERIEQDEALADRIENAGVETFVEQWEKIPLFATQSKEAREKLRKQRLQNSEIGLAGSLRGMGTGAQKSLWGELATVEVPVNLVVGELDLKFRRIAEDMQKRMKNAEVTTVCGAGHAVHVEQSRFFDKIVVAWINHKERNE